MAASKNSDLKNCWVLQGGSVGGNCKDNFMNKKESEIGR